MRRFRRILVCAGRVSESEPALKRASELARANDGTLKLVHVVEATSGYYMRGFVPAEWRIRELLEKKIQDRLEQMIRPFRNKGVGATAEVLFGRPALEITREVLRNGHDLVMKSARGDDSFLGTVANRLIRVCRCPVWVVDGSPQRTLARVLAAVDPEPGEPEQERLNIRILQLASSVCEIEGADLHVLHAWRDVYEYGWTSYGEDVFGEGISEAELREFRSSARLEASERVHGLLSKSGVSLPEENVHLREGSPEAVIPPFLRENEIGLIVMGTVARSGIKGFFVGNTAEKILRNVECSVLAVKPDEFVSPVKLEAKSPAEHSAVAGGRTR